MSTHVQLRKAATLAAAGKMALGAATASASGLGKVDTPGQEPQIPRVSLEQVGYPIDILTPPTSEMQQATGLGKTGSGSASPSDVGYLWSGDVAAQQGVQPRIDFMVTGVRNDRPMTVFLAYALDGNRADAWMPTGSGRLELDPASIQVIAGVNVQPNFSNPFPPTALGRVPETRTRTVTVPMMLSDLSDPSLAGNNIFFQAIAIPMGPDGEFEWEQAQVSEVDHYIIERYVDDTNTGSKSTDPSSKTGGGGDGQSGGK